ncbi:hypothetical protein TNCV_4748631 [Trichonephila clavipes]|nr:hypothetical protein TNCV_4748631 [Trichonephila clavipes]
MKTRCLKCGENHRTGMCEIKEKIEDPLCINCKAKGHMASSIQCPLFPKPRKGKGKSPANNLKRNSNTTPVTPGLLYTHKFLTQIPDTRCQHPDLPPRRQRKKSENTKNNSFNKETLNVPQNASSDFGYFQTIIEMQKILTLFPSLLTEMEKSSKCTEPTEKLNCLLRVVCSSINNV